MFSHIANRAIAAFERRWSYDGTYMHEIVADCGIAALAPLNALAKVGRYRRDVPASVYYAAKITASIAADCGPCAQLQLRMAEAAHVDAQTLRALIAGDRDALGADERLGFDLACATLARADASDVREAIRQRFGPRALVSLAYGIVAAGAYPAFKYALGYGHACATLTLG